MKVHAEWRVGTDLFDIWLFETDTLAGRSRQLMLIDGGTFANGESRPA